MSFCRLEQPPKAIVATTTAVNVSLLFIAILITGGLPSAFYRALDLHLVGGCIRVGGGPSLVDYTAVICWLLSITRRAADDVVLVR